MMEATYST